MKLLVVNGPNINMLGIREPSIYGNKTYRQLVSFLHTVAKEENVDCRIVQNNEEGKLVTIIQRAYRKYDGIIINAGAYTHYSIAILDALKAVNIPYVEVHLSEIEKRDNYRKVSITGEASVKIISGHGFESYKIAIHVLKSYLLEK